MTIDPANIGGFDNDLQKVLYEWAGVETVATNSRGTVFNGQQLAYLEALFGQPYVNGLGSTNPLILSEQAPLLGQVWDTVFSGIKARFLVQDTASPLSQDFTIDQATDTILPTNGILIALAGIETQAPADTASALPYWIDALTVVSASLEDAAQTETLDTADIGAILTDVAPTWFSAPLLSAVADGTMVFVDGSSIGGGAPGGNEVYINGNDLVEVTASNMTIWAQGGANEFVVGTGMGITTIEDTASGTADDALLLGPGIGESQVKVSGDANGDIILALDASGDQVVLQGQLNGGAGVSEVLFTDGTVWSAQQLVALELAGTTGSDSLYGSSGADVFDGKGAPSGSQDYEQGNGGADTFIYNAGYGDLEINENTGNENRGGPASTAVLELGAGIGASGLTATGDSAGDLVLTDSVTGDQVTIDHQLYDFFGDPDQYGVAEVQLANGTVLTRAQLAAMATTGTTGANTLYGTSGADVFDGKGAPAGTQDYEEGNGGADTFIYNAGYGDLDINEIDGYGVSVLELGAGIKESQITVTADSLGDLILSDGIAGDQIKLDVELGGSPYGVAEVQFADGTVWTLQQLTALETTGTKGADSLYGIEEAGGAPQVFDGKGAPAGTQDYESGFSGIDTFIYNAGYGALEIDEFNFAYTNSAAVLDLGAGISASQLTVTTDGAGDIILTDGITGDTIKLDDETKTAYNGSAAYGVGEVQFANGTVLTRTRLLALAGIGTTGADTLYGSSGADVFDGKGAPAGKQDYEEGNGGTDTFIYNAGYGALEINEEAAIFSTDTAVLQLGAGISESAIAVRSDNGGDVTLTDGIAGDRILIDSQLNLDSNGDVNFGVTGIKFADGTVWGVSQILALATTGTTGADTLYGARGATMPEVFDGKGAPAGMQDYEDGSGTANDTFIFDAGYGHLEIDEYQNGGSATLEFGAGISESAITVSSDGRGGFYLTDGISGDRVELDGETYGYGNAVEVQFANGTVLTGDQLLSMSLVPDTLYGTSGSDTLYGTTGADVFDGKGAAAGSEDYEYGEGGADTFIYNAGYGALDIYEEPVGSSVSPVTAVLQLGAGISDATVNLTTDGYGDLYLSDGISGDRLEVYRQFITNAYGVPYGVAEIVFADGTVWTSQQLMAIAKPSPSISGFSYSTATTSDAPINPFSSVTITEPNTGATETLSIQVTGNGTLKDGSGFTGLAQTTTPGLYTLSGTAVAATAELDSLIFTPIGTPGTSTTTLSLTLSDSVGAQIGPFTTTVIDTNPAAPPTLSGMVAGQTTYFEAAVTPFAHVTVTDPDVGVTDRLIIEVSGNGTLSDGAGFSGLTPVSGAPLFTLSGTASAVTAELDALVFTPAAGSGTTTLGLIDTNSANEDSAFDQTTTVTDSDVAVAPVIAGTVTGQTTTSEAPVTPFSKVTLTDANSGATDTLSIQVTGGGTLKDGSGFSGLTQTGTAGLYSLTGTASTITAELDALVFTPAIGTPNASATSTLTLNDTDTAGEQSAQSTVTVTDTDPAVAPTLSGMVAGQTTYFEAAVTPFAHVTITDPDAGVTDRLIIEVSGNGTLSDGAGFSGLTPVSGAPLFTLSGTASAVTAELDALVFTPAAGSGTTTLGLIDTNSANEDSAFDQTTTVTDSDVPVAPVISGPAASHATTSGAPVTPFSGTTLTDIDPGVTDTLSVQMSGGGTLSDGSGFSELKTSSTAGLYTITGTASAITAELDALIFTPAIGTPNASATTTLTLSDTNTDGKQSAVSTTSVTDTDPAVAPTIAGVTATHATTSDAPVTPFAGATLGDLNSGVTDTLSIQVTGGGTLADGTGFSGLTASSTAGLYTLTGTASAITAELDALIFTPSGTPNAATTTTLTLTDSDSAGKQSTTVTTSVTDTDPAVAPTVFGPVATLTTPAGTPVNPFSQVTITDPNAGVTERLIIEVSGNGTLADGAGFSGLTPVSGVPLFTLSGTASAVTAELDALTFTAAAGASTGLGLVATDSAGEANNFAWLTTVNGDAAGTSTASSQDVYDVTPATGDVTISLASASSDTVAFGSGIDADDLWFARSGNALQIDLLGTTEHVTIANWATGTATLAVTSADNLQVDTQLNALINAMATFSADHAGFNPTTATAMPTDATLQTAYAAAWHEKAA